MYMTKLRSGLANDRRGYGYYCGSSQKVFNMEVISGPGAVYSGDLHEVTIPGSFYDAGEPLPNTLDDGDVPIPMANIVFNFFGTNYSNNLYVQVNINCQTYLPTDILQYKLGYS